MSDAVPTKAELEGLLAAARTAGGEADRINRQLQHAESRLHYAIRELVAAGQLELPEWAAADLAAADERMAEWQAALQTANAAHRVWERAVERSQG